MGLRLHDTAVGRKLDFKPAVDGKVSMYVCGPTVDNVPHLGHGRFSLVFDVLRRYLIHRGYDVTYTSNITDIDDKILARARAEESTPAEVAATYEKAWYEAMDGLGVMRPDHDPHATAYIDEMIALIGRLVADDKAYVTGDGVYFVASSVDDYGLLARQSLESLRAGARIEVDDDKRSPVDFALWKLVGDDEEWAWDSPWGRGRPGWHTECVVMSLDLLGEGFDIHGGGFDLAFPHHENERAQAVAADKTFARRWVHNGFVEVDGEKMSKSLGNFTSLTDLLDRHDGRAYRLLVLRSHYRSPVEVTPATIADAEAALGRLDSFARRTADLAAASPAQPDPAVVEAFVEAMDDDLDTPRAMALLFEQVRAANSALDADDRDAAAVAAASARHIAAAVGLDFKVKTDDVPDAVLAKASERDAARAAKDFERADRLRDELVSAGWTVEDTPEGTKVRRG